MEIRVDGKLGHGVGAKDLILGIIGQMTTDGGTGHVVEYRGSAIEAISMEERMTVCNMTIEGGARAGMVAADQKTVDYLRGRRYLPKGADFDRMAQQWLTLPYRRRREVRSLLRLRRRRLRPAGHLGHQSRDGDGGHPQGSRSRFSFADANHRRAAELALEYMGLQPGTPIDGYQDRPGLYRLVHQWPVTDLKAAAEIVKGRKVASTVHAMVVPGSQDGQSRSRTARPDRVFIGSGLRMA